MSVRVRAENADAVEVARRALVYLTRLRLRVCGAAAPRLAKRCRMRIAQGNKGVCCDHRTI